MARQWLGLSGSIEIRSLGKYLFRVSKMGKRRKNVLHARELSHKTGFLKEYSKLHICLVMGHENLREHCSSWSEFELIGRPFVFAGISSNT
jgi:hypothetical protein